MAKQKGFLNITGSLGDTTFTEGVNGFQARKKSKLSAAQVRTSPAFARTRENNSEFSKAIAGAKQIRHSVNVLLSSQQTVKDNSRLVKKLMTIIKHDTTSTRGHRNIVDGPLSLLEGYEFNSLAALGKVMKAVVKPTINRVTGELTINIPSFVPEFSIMAPQGSTHFKFISAGIEINFEQTGYVRDVKESAVIALDKVPTAVMNIVHNVTAASTNSLLLVFGIQFYQSVAGGMNPMLTGSSNLLTVIAVSKL